MFCRVSRVLTCIVLVFLRLFCSCNLRRPPEVSSRSAACRSSGEEAWDLSQSASDLKEQSCAPSFRAPQTISKQVCRFWPAEESAKRLPAGVTYAGGWHLTSDNASFGGLSGLEVTAGGDLLAVSDDGAFVWLGLTDGAPDGSGNLAYMLGADGSQLHGKALADSEGLSLSNGLAIVSFERTHRVSAFALEACGAAAREAVISALPGTRDGTRIDENRGAEALTVTPGGTIRFGFETVDGGTSPLGSIAGPDEAGWTGELAPNPAGYAFVGLDTVAVGGHEESFWLFRSYDPIRGNRNVVKWGQDKQIIITRPLVTDNFEGIAAEPRADGSVRLWIVSDDNFSDKQRTLLLAFDIAAPSE
ncbi:MAG: esterase-like activity of phytase family protein [Hyphomonas sp.]